MQNNWLSRALIFLIQCYQRYISPLTINACRYYPSCSHYALWLLRFENPLFAMAKITQRVLTCNQLFRGGIAYPQAKIQLKRINFRIDSAPKIKYWLIPTKNMRFLGIISPLRQAYTMRVYIIKSFY